MIRCPICNADNEDNERFCRDCGQKLPGTTRPGAPPAGAPPPDVPAADAPAADAPAAGAPIAGAPIAGFEQPSVEAPGAGAVGATPASGVPLAANPADGPRAEPVVTNTGEDRAEASGPTTSIGAPGEVTCPACGTRNESSFRFCKSCGQALVAAASSAGASQAIPAVEETGAAMASEPLVETVAPSPAASVTVAPAESFDAVHLPASDANPPPSAAPAAPPAAQAQSDTSSAPTVCPSCGKRATGAEHFCSECGARMAPVPPSAAPLVCPTCSSPYDAGDKFCKSCGTRLPSGGGQVVGPHLVLSANGEETIYPLDRPEVSIGRSPSNDIAISSDGYISSYHARLVIENGEAFVEDAGSTNGTFMRVRHRMPLSEGDEIKVGQSILKYVP